MTQEQINELRKLADPLVPWCVNHAKESAYGTAVIGHVDEDDNMHEVACFDLTMYDGFEGDSLKMAQYYATANPAAILALIQQRDELLAEMRVIEDILNRETNTQDMGYELFRRTNFIRRAIETTERKP